VLTDGAGNSAYWEHRWAAEQLGIPLVEPGDVELRGDRLQHGGEPVDVVYRRTDADRLDTDVGRRSRRPRSARSGSSTRSAAGLADDKLVHAYVEDMVRFYLREEPLLRSVPTLDLARAEHRERALDEAPSSCSSRATATAATAW
jgi:uncharacterized circularly permuted ATP-grasp superfamily protein